MTTTLQDILAGSGGTGSAGTTTGGSGGKAAAEQFQDVRRRSVRMLRPARTPVGVPAALTVSAVLAVSASVTVGLLMESPLARMPYRRLVNGAGAWNWSDPATFAASTLAMAVGLVMLALAALPGRTRLIPLESGDPHMVIGVTRSGLRRTLREAAESVDEVKGARVRLTSRIVEVTVFTDAERTGPVLRRVGAAVGDRLAGLGAMCAGDVVVRLRGKGGR
ncbi:hypothetical protein GCM10022252_38110 [Streptosporangium oxazolinicum]|uniref:DUF6286 domain-containing protein n=1 Tax=Streptosporangium oxazolinicum TaxID=909287 RepID=A0ABP8AZ79_9ACTN